MSKNALSHNSDGYERTRAIFFYDIAEHSGFYTVEDVITRSRDKMSILEDLYIILKRPSLSMLPLLGYAEVHGT